MEEFLEVEARLPAGKGSMRSMICWVRTALCKYRSAQNIIGNRKDAQGGAVTAAMAADPNDKRAHGCPFVLDSIETKQFFIAKSLLGDNDEAEIEMLVHDQIDDFKNRHPAYDPVITHQPCPGASLFKTDLIFFPNVDDQNGCQLVIRVRDNLKEEFMKNGMMLGEFFPSNKSGSLYNPKYHALTAPIPAFAIRYMVADDRIFATKPPFKALYELYFPPNSTP
jgi:hypothetical protein